VEHNVIVNATEERQYRIIIAVVGIARTPTVFFYCWLLPKTNNEMEHTVVHEGVSCDECGCIPIRGRRYKCTVCVNYDLCMVCNIAVPDQHVNGFHPFVEMRRTQEQYAAGKRQPVFRTFERKPLPLVTMMLSFQNGRGGGDDEDDMKVI
jgi:hypothetical protein